MVTWENCKNLVISPVGGEHLVRLLCKRLLIVNGGLKDIPRLPKNEAVCRFWKDIYYLLLNPLYTLTEIGNTIYS